MDFAFSKQDQEFRQEVRDFLADTLPDDWATHHVGDEEGEDSWEFTRAFQKKLAEKGWLVVSWPKEYGGQEWPYFWQVIFNEEIAYHQSPKAEGIGVRNTGSILIAHGSDEQKARHLPPIAGADIVWCQLFSEPNAGSDLANVQTSAEDQGDYFVVNGGKIWSSHAHLADWGLLLARTNPDAPKHRGLSYFLLDMNTPGITIQPIVSMARVHRFNQVFFDNVKIPRDCLVGERDRGWALGTSTLNTERSSAAAAASSSRMLEDLSGFITEHESNGSRHIPSALRHRIADLRARTQVSRALSYRVAWMQTKGLPFSYEASIARVLTGELSQGIAWTAMQVMGLYGPVQRGSQWAKLRGKAERIYLNTVASTIAGGTSEIQRNTIAMRGLGLPRS